MKENNDRVRNVYGHKLGKMNMMMPSTANDLQWPVYVSRVEFFLPCFSSFQAFFFLFLSKVYNARWMLTAVNVYDTCMCI